MISLSFYANRFLEEEERNAITLKTVFSSRSLDSGGSREMIYIILYKHLMCVIITISNYSTRTLLKSGVFFALFNSNLLELEILCSTIFRATKKQRRNIQEREREQQLFNE